MGQAGSNAWMRPASRDAGPDCGPLSGSGAGGTAEWLASVASGCAPKRAPTPGPGNATSREGATGPGRAGVGCSAAGSTAATCAIAGPRRRKESISAASIRRIAEAIPPGVATGATAGAGTRLRAAKPAEPAELAELAELAIIPSRRARSWMGCNPDPTDVTACGKVPLKVAAGWSSTSVGSGSLASGTTFRSNSIGVRSPEAATTAS